MPDLTLEQVKQAGKTAFWRDDLLLDSPTFMYLPYNPLETRFIRGDSPDKQRYIDPRLQAIGVAHTLPPTGWHHFPGCDCEFCRP